ncbi:MAG: branched-chain amino acid aminotransferase [Candidatus Omnitrophica bacterium]|nr:branched-chain amino acid aminotransferase [Candidatus Omnitrophota bacterium]
MGRIVFFNDRFLKDKDVKISVFNRGFLYGEGVFETMRSYNGVIFKLDKHLRRLFHSSEKMYLKIPYNQNKLKGHIYTTLKKNFLKEAYIRVALWRREEGFGLDFKEKIADTLIVAQPLKKFPRRVYKEGIKAVALKGKNTSSLISNIKSFNYLENILARKMARSLGFDEVILLNTEGFVSEASSSNIFIVRNGVLTTPPIKAGILAGITREVIIDLAKRCLFDVYERNISARELLKADEIFLTNSISEIVPVAEVNGKRIGSGLAGEFTRLLAVLYRLEAEKQV